MGEHLLEGLLAGAGGLLGEELLHQGRPLAKLSWKSALSLRVLHLRLLLLPNLRLRGI